MIKVLPDNEVDLYNISKQQATKRDKGPRR